MDYIYNDKNKSCPVSTDPPMRPCVLWCLVHAKHFYAIVVFSFYIELDVQIENQVRTTAGYY